MIIKKEDAIKYLTRAKELQCEFPWMDLHVSPFEVIYNRFTYSADSKQAGIFSLSESLYKPPAIGPLRVSAREKDPDGHCQQEAEQMSILLYRQAFAHIGPRVLNNQMMLSGIKKSLLLPVFRPSSDGKAEMEIVARIYGGDEKLMLGYCVPNTVAIDHIAMDVEAASRRYGIKAIKLNANISGIKISTPKGKERVEAILDACEKTRLPIFVHGGRSPVLENQEAKNYSSIKNMSQIDWGITRKPVVICHGGMMGSPINEIENEIMPVLKRILSSYEHVMVDIAALDMPTLNIILKCLDVNRIIFGSDYHYFTQWGAIVKLYYSLMEVSDNAEDHFIKIVAINPSRCISGVI